MDGEKKREGGEGVEKKGKCTNEKKSLKAKCFPLSPSANEWAGERPAMALKYL